ncbi:ribonuclease HIII [Sporosarcina gallistercoris]|uniref:Ribonuclease HIII n=1 Tax=Sporosarcina gallistercoris TaxID=2762245 RepID=A0ABR8PIL4_9BACL|nr:ribonuclease HIII [Sporosarcina gallistercoris]MBD7907993.1 ribonuclease HIII [Sporosarcina gallistercoris]
MANSVIILSDEKLTALKAYYASDVVKRDAPGVVFAAKTANASITAYRSGKVLFQGGGAEQEAAKWESGMDAGSSASIKKPLTKGTVLPDRLETLSVIGSDETGTGDFFGPVTVCACYVRADQIPLVAELGVKDSKLLTDPYMRSIAPDLKSVLTYSVLTLQNEKYNTVQAKGWSQGKIKALLHNQAIRHVLRKLEEERPDYILIDQFAERGVYYNHLKNEREIVRENVLFSTKAEGLHVAVAAASIIARVAFLDEMDRLSELAGRTLPKGASKKVDETAAAILLAKGEPFLRSMTKWHFANAKKATVLAAKTRG